jgi:hypothetical protein
LPDEASINWAFTYGSKRETGCPEMCAGEALEHSNAQIADSHGHAAAAILAANAQIADSHGHAAAAILAADVVGYSVDGVLGLAGSASWHKRWLRFRLMIDRGPPERPQASEEKRSHETLCRIGCVGERDQRA